MEYTIIHNGQSYDLTPYNFKVAEELEKAENVNNSTQLFKVKCKGMYDILVKVLGKNVVEEIVGAFDKADPNNINIVFMEVIEAYNKPLSDFNSEKTARTLSNSEFEKMIEMANAIPNLEKLVK